MNGSLFDFDPELVEIAMWGDDEDARTKALECLCKAAFNDYSRLEAEIKRRYPSWPMEWIDRARDLFLHDRFLKLFANPRKVDDLNALCYTMLKESIVDAYRFFNADRRDAGITVPGDKTGYGEDGLLTFFQAHETEILASAGRIPDSASDNVAKAEILKLIKGYLTRLPEVRRRVMLMWMKGFTEREIAEELGLTTGNVGCIVSRVISFLREKLCKKV